MESTGFGFGHGFPSAFFLMPDYTVVEFLP